MKILTSTRFALLSAVTLCCTSHAASLITIEDIIIEDFTTFQRVRFDGEGAFSSANMISLGSLGGYRKMILSSSGNNEGQTSLAVSATFNRLVLSTPIDATAHFTISWEGDKGTGFGATDLTTFEELSLHKLNFTLGSADKDTDFTWTFEDISGNSASYTGNFPAHSSGSPSLQYNINLADFVNANALSPVDWDAINKISFSSGGAQDGDISIVGQITVTAVPEPTTALISALGALSLLRRRR